MAQGGRRGFRLVLYSGLLCGAGSFALYLAALDSTSSDLENERAAARKVGMPIDFEDIPNYPVPVRDNAAPIYRELDRLAKGPMLRPTSLIDKAYGSSAKSADKKLAEDALPEMQPVFDLLGKLDKTPRCWFNRDWAKGSQLVITEYAGMKRDVHDLVFDADWLDRHGRPEDAMKQLQLCFRIARDAGTEPILISMLVRDSCRTLAVKALAEFVERHEDDKQRLNEAAALLQANMDVADQRRYLVGEIAMGKDAAYHSYEILHMDAPQGADDPFAKAERATLSSRFVRDNLDVRRLKYWRQVWTRLPKDPNTWEGFGQAFVTAGRLMDRSHFTVWGWMDGILFPEFVRSSESVGLLLARERVLAASIAVLKIRAVTGRPPKTLPTSLGDVGIDPFDKEPLRYRPKGNGFTLYSIGQDRVDNGGIPRDPSHYSSTGFDEVLTFK